MLAAINELARRISIEDLTAEDCVRENRSRIVTEYGREALTFVDDEDTVHEWASAVQRCSTVGYPLQERTLDDFYTRYGAQYFGRIFRGVGEHCLPEGYLPPGTEARQSLDACRAYLRVNANVCEGARVVRKWNPSVAGTVVDVSRDHDGIRTLDTYSAEVQWDNGKSTTIRLEFLRPARAEALRQEEEPIG